MDKEVSISEQVAQCRLWAERHGCEVVCVYEEPGRSGASGQRPEFQRMIADAAIPAPVRPLVTWNLARFGRADTDEAGHWRYVLREAGVEVGHVHEGDRYEGPAGAIIRAVDQAGANKLLVDMSANMVRHQLRGVLEAFVARLVVCPAQPRQPRPVSLDVRTLPRFLGPGGLA